MKWEWRWLRDADVAHFFANNPDQIPPEYWSEKPILTKHQQMWFDAWKDLHGMAADGMGAKRVSAADLLAYVEITGVEQPGVLLDVCRKLDDTWFQQQHEFKKKDAEGSGGRLPG